MKNASSPASENLDLDQLWRLHGLLSTNRITIIIYAAAFVVPPQLVLIILIVLAIAFAPYVLYVLYRSNKTGWILFFFIIVGLPLVFVFINTGIEVLNTFLRFMPPLAFYFYCFLLRLSVNEWLSDASPSREMTIMHHEDHNRLDR